MMMIEFIGAILINLSIYLPIYLKVCKTALLSNNCEKTVRPPEFAACLAAPHGVGGRVTCAVETH